jgi:hypothetical protein
MRASAWLNTGVLILLLSLRLVDLAWSQDDPSEAEIHRHLLFLAADSLMGRETGSSGEKRAADYIAAELLRNGLEPMGGGYFQYLPVHASYPRESARLLLYEPEGERSLRMYEDYLIVKSGAQTIVPAPTTMVFAGYGIEAPEFGYSDYREIDVAGKIAVVISGEPPSTDPDFFNGPFPTLYSSNEAKIRTAMAHGAVGSVLIRHPQDEAFQSWESLAAEYSFPDMTLANSVTGHFSIIVSSRVGAGLFQTARFTWPELLELDIRGSLVCFPLVTRLSFQEESVQRDFWARNVLAMLPGRDHPEEYILLSAHYDHLGIGKPVKGDSIYNGAVDNALGTAGLIELARLLSQITPEPRRSILFAFFTGEEKGMLGSRYYVDHPAVPLEKTLANINIDGLATFAPFHDLIGLGAEFSTLAVSMTRVAQRLGLVIKTFPPELAAYAAFARSDQIAFAQAGIPSVLTTEGLKSDAMTEEEMLRRRIRWSEEIYHSPGDDLDQPISYDAATQHLAFLFEWTKDLANGDFIPEWNKSAPYKRARKKGHQQ